MGFLKRVKYVRVSRLQACEREDAANERDDEMRSLNKRDVTRCTAESN